jgi:hypothetical protein
MLHGGQGKSEVPDRPMANRTKSRDVLNGHANGIANGNDPDGKADMGKGKGGKSGNGSGKEGKLKSEKSMKNVAGALARFWVG